MVFAYQKLEGNFFIVVIGVINCLLLNGSNVEKNDSHFREAIGNWLLGIGLIKRLAQNLILWQAPKIAIQNRIWNILFIRFIFA
jgi:hypothetical protein